MSTAISSLVFIGAGNNTTNSDAINTKSSTYSNWLVYCVIFVVVVITILLILYFNKVSEKKKDTEKDEAIDLTNIQKLHELVKIEPELKDVDFSILLMYLKSTIDDIKSIELNSTIDKLKSADLSFNIQNNQ